ncbi:flagellar basal body-associated protein FliL [Colwellia hornerae]|uniref:Flagellar protein FliL n=1 Tax=Colwellia hornerae TaxID=89402 RepID=A0A5C6QJV4_9GAMM|nr:flagellar basal body-associated protein FliL [Colwellia hornerae]TWX54119.1 flagellar basal body-associated protein FliL [Colwellia hornerae]TWX60894.1 flagellar basal body-associated protein FliL [Colwellia hornerae]TWX69224.1 flagellar basal body-associated protein FliL [Colwellia hornerae]
MADDKGEGKELELDNKGKSKKMIIIIAAVVILAIGGGAAYFFLGGDEVSQEQLDAELDGDTAVDGEAAESTTASTGSALYVPMPRPFRFNVPGAARDRFVEIRVQLLVRGSDNEEAAKKHVPLIESTLLATFSQSNADDLATSAGKTSLKQKSLVEVHKIMKEVEGNNVVEQVLFTGFVMQ